MSNATLVLKNLAGDLVKSFVFDQGELDDGDDFFAVVNWVLDNPEKSHMLVGQSEFYRLILLCKDVHARLWNIDVDDSHEFPFPDGGEEVVKDWVEAVIERADWTFDD